MTSNVNLSKFVVYAVEQQEPGIRLSKNISYVVEQAKYGTFYQDESAKRPTYREASSGSIAYFDMSDTGVEFNTAVPLEGTYTLIVYYADETFEVSEVDFDAGENVVPITENFNQACIIRGKNIHRYVIGSIKEGMKARAV